jgi:hypothetical protein
MASRNCLTQRLVLWNCTKVIFGWIVKPLTGTLENKLSSIKKRLLSPRVQHQIDPKGLLDGPVLPRMMIGIVQLMIWDTKDG